MLIFYAINGVKPGSNLVVWVDRIVQKYLKERDSEFESFAFWVFVHDLNDPRCLPITNHITKTPGRFHNITVFAYLYFFYEIVPY